MTAVRKQRPNPEQGLADMDYMHMLKADLYRIRYYEALKAENLKASVEAAGAINQLPLICTVTIIYKFLCLRAPRRIRIETRPL
jgi:hypothetical protein